MTPSPFQDMAGKVAQLANILQEVIEAVDQPAGTPRCCDPASWAEPDFDAVTPLSDLPHEDRP